MFNGRVRVKPKDVGDVIEALGELDSKITVDRRDVSKNYSILRISSQLPPNAIRFVIRQGGMLFIPKSMRDSSQDARSIRVMTEPEKFDYQMGCSHAGISY